jgi:hypothetical protein
LNVERYLWTAPDVAALAFGSLAVAAARFRTLLGGLGPAAGGESEEQAAARARGVTALFALCFLGYFFAVLPLSGRNFQLLTRYYVPLMPAALFMLSDALCVRTSRRFTLAALGVTAVLFAANRDGRFYPRIPERFGNDFSIAERSGEYRDLLAVQREVVRALEALAADRPVFYDLPVHFLASRPALGYVRAPLVHGHCILTEEPYRAARLPDFPACFVLARTSPWLGGRRIDAVLRQAERHPGYLVETVSSARRGPFEARILQVRRRDAVCPPLPAAGS